MVIGPVGCSGANRAQPNVAERGRIHRGGRCGQRRDPVEGRQKSLPLGEGLFGLLNEAVFSF